MIPKEILPFYTHLAFDPDSPEVYVNLSTFYRDKDKQKEFKYNTDQQGYSLLYSIGGGAQQTVEVFPPYRYTYGINRLTGSASTSFSFTYPNYTDPDYPLATVGFEDQLTAPTNILARSCSIAATVNVSGLGSQTLYIGNFINETREIIFTRNPINLNVDGLLFLYSVTGRDGTPVYEPGVDYVYDPDYQSITFEDTTVVDLYTPIVVKIGVATLDGAYKTITSSGTHDLPPLFSYGAAVTGPEGTSASVSLQVNWESVIDRSESSGSYVLSLADETGCRTLASSGSNNISITDINALVHKTIFKDFKDAVRVSMPIPVESEVNLTSTIKYEEVEITSASVPGYNERRVVTFDITGDSPIQDATLETEAYCRNGAFINSTYRTGSIRSLPPALGVSEIEDSVLNNNQVPLNINPTFSMLVPADDSGLLARYDLTADMDLTNPISTAWGLLFAASYKDSNLILTNLKALVYQAKQRGWIKLDKDQYVIDNTVSAGLPIYFSATDPNYVESFKEVGSNAFLGWAACIAVLSLTDDELRTYYAMQGSDSAFQTELLLTLEAMALFVANGVSRVTWFTAYKEDAGTYSYDLPSLSATVYADMFLSYLLAIRYNSTAHYVAAKLDYNLSLLPDDIESLYYDEFTERDYAAVQYPFDPASPDPDYKLDQITGSLIIYNFLKSVSGSSSGSNTLTNLISSYTPKQGSINGLTLINLVISQKSFTAPISVINAANTAINLPVFTKYGVKNAKLLPNFVQPGYTPPAPVQVGFNTYTTSNASSLLNTFILSQGTNNVINTGGGNYTFNAPTVTFKSSGSGIYNVGNFGLTPATAGPSTETFQFFVTSYIQQNNGGEVWPRYRFGPINVINTVPFVETLTQFFAAGSNRTQYLQSLVVQNCYWIIDGPFYKLVYKGQVSGVWPSNWVLDPNSYLSNATSLNVFNTTTNNGTSTLLHAPLPPATNTPGWWKGDFPIYVTGADNARINTNNPVGVYILEPSGKITLASAIDWW